MLGVLYTYAAYDTTKLAKVSTVLQSILKLGTVATMSHQERVMYVRIHEFIMHFWCHRMVVQYIPVCILDNDWP